MKPYRITALLLLVCVTTGAQKILPLTFHRKLHHIHQLPFNRVMVFDNRFDTTSIKIIQDGSYPVKVLSLENPASLAIKRYIETAISTLQKKAQLLYINIKQFRFENLNYRFFFSADAHFQINHHFIKVAAIKQNYLSHFNWSPSQDSADRSTVTTALNSLIETVNYNYYHQNGNSVYIDSFNTIDESVTSDWIMYPVITAIQRVIKPLCCAAFQHSVEKYFSG